jgi:hypothetical protein
MFVVARERRRENAGARERERARARARERERERGNDTVTGQEYKVIVDDMSESKVYKVTRTH